MKNITLDEIFDIIESSPINSFPKELKTKVILSDIALETIYSSNTNWKNLEEDKEIFFKDILQYDNSIQEVV